MKNKKRYNVNKIKRNLSYHVLTAVTVYWLERLDINSTSCIQIVMNSAGRVICGLNMFDHISRVCVINFTGCQFHDECNINFVCWCTRLIRGLRHTSTSLFQLSMAEADCDRPRGDLVAVTTTTNFGRRFFAMSVPMPWNGGTSFLKTPGTFSRCSPSHPDSRLICSCTVTDTNKHNTDTNAVFADSLRPCNELAPCYGALEIVGFIKSPLATARAA